MRGGMRRVALHGGDAVRAASPLPLSECGSCVLVIDDERPRRATYDGPRSSASHDAPLLWKSRLEERPMPAIGCSSTDR